MSSDFLLLWIPRSTFQRTSGPQESSPPRVLRAQAPEQTLTAAANYTTQFFGFFWQSLRIQDNKSLCPPESGGPSLPPQILKSVSTATRGYGGLGGDKGSRKKRWACTRVRGVPLGPQWAWQWSLIKHRQCRHGARACWRHLTGWSHLVIIIRLSAPSPSLLDSGETEASRGEWPAQVRATPSQPAPWGSTPALRCCCHFISMSEKQRDILMGRDQLMTTVWVQTAPSPNLVWNDTHHLFLQISIQLDVFHWTGGHSDVHHAAPC